MVLQSNDENLMRQKLSLVPLKQLVSPCGGYEAVSGVVQFGFDATKNHVW